MWGVSSPTETNCLSTWMSMRLKCSVKPATATDKLATRKGWVSLWKGLIWEGGVVCVFFFSMQEVSGWCVGCTTESWQAGLQAPRRVHWPHHRLRSVASGTQHGACHSISSHPGRSRSNPPGAHCRQYIWSRVGASKHRGLRVMQTRRCPRR